MNKSHRLTLRFSSFAHVALVLACLGSPALGRDLVQDFDSALRFDPTYRGALAEFEVGQRGVKQARSVFFPEATFSTQRLADDVGARSTLSISQPIVDIEKLMAFRQAGPRQLLAEVGLLGKRQDLAMRLVKAGNILTLAMENITLNGAKSMALEQQAVRARRMLEGGQGTVTDLRDIEVKVNQAKAQQVVFQTELQIGLNQYQSITGTQPLATQFILPAKHGATQVSLREDFANAALASGPSVLAARYNLEIAEYEVRKLRSSFLPTVNAVYSRSQAGGSAANVNQYVGIGFSVPLKAGTAYGLDAAQAGVVRTQESLRETEAKVRLEAQRFALLVSSGAQALRLQKEAIAAAELSVEANTQSYQGGVRSAIDVLNAIQTLYQVKSEYVKLATSQAESIISLMLLASTDPREAVAQAYRYLYISP